MENHQAEVNCKDLSEVKSFSCKTLLNFVWPTALNVQIDGRQTSKWSLALWVFNLICFSMKIPLLLSIPLKLTLLWLLLSYSKKLNWFFFTDIAKNSLTLVPTTTISLVSSSLKRLNLADNYFNFLGSTGPNDGNKTFPKLGKLEELILDNCAIRSRHEQKSVS